MSTATFCVREGMRAGAELGFDSLAVTLSAAAFIGGIMVVQAGPFVHLLGAGPVLGWAAGYTVLREFGPLLVGLVFSGRVGARNAAELAVLRSSEQLDALRAIGLSPFWLVVLPRVLAMILAAACLSVLGDLAAVLAGSVVGRALLGVEVGTFIRSFSALLHPMDFAAGVIKAVAFGVAIASVSSYFGLTAEGGAQGVGRAATRSVVWSALTLLVIDYLLTGALS